MRVWMKRGWFSAACLACLIDGGHAWGEEVASQACQVPEVAERGTSTTKRSESALFPRITIEKPGTFCLDSDLRQSPLKDPRRGGAEVFSLVEAMIRIRANDVTLDLAGHTVSNGMRHGMTLIWFSKFAIGTRGGTRLRHAHIRNGQLSSPGPTGIGIDLTASKPYGQRSLQPASIPDGLRSSEVFEDTRHLIESMNIDSGKRGIQLDGQNNIIRNNRIVVDGATAIVAQGPGIIIEDNIIEVRKDFSSFSEHDRRRESMTPFPIRLIQADGAIVRNNQIRLVDRALRGSLPAAIELVESKDVSVQENRFGGMEAPVHADAASSYRDAGNHPEPCPAGATRYLPPDDAVDSGRLRVPACR